MEDQLKNIREKIENMKAEAIESRKWYPERYLDARKSKTTEIKTLNFDRGTK